MDTKYRFLAFLKKRYIALLVILLLVVYALYTYVLKASPFFAANPYLNILLVFLISLVFCSAYRFTIKGISKSINKILSERCDPDEYLRIYRYIIHALHRKKKPLHFSYFLGYSEGLIAAGKYQDALDVLNSIKGFGTGKKRLEGIASYYDDLCAAYLGLRKTDKAREAYKGVEKSFEAMKPGNEVSGYSFISKSFLIKMAQNGYKGSEKFFARMFEEARTNHNRVKAMFYLGEIFLHNGDAARAKEAYGFVEANGNKLYIASEAKERLSGLA
jgi:hypothetical protein